MHSLYIAALALSAFVFPAPDVWASSELLHDVAIQEPPSADTRADGPFNNPKPQSQPTQPRFGWPNNKPNNNANRPHSTNTNAPELTWNHEKGILELEGPKTVPPAGYGPAQNPAQSMAPAPNPYYPPAPPPAQQEPKTPTGWDIPLAAGGPGMADMKHDMPKPAVFHLEQRTRHASPNSSNNPKHRLDGMSLP
ncbi:hypothetical protein E2P81_ATG01314 [Venturia nashicola]|nr:hypothetical protein E2P81_ATG01314 [Venturia nashicola]